MEVEVMPLTGEEIITDVLRHVEWRLRNDCNLRESDAYAGGYDGKIDIKLNCHGLDVSKVEVEVGIGKPVVDAGAVVIAETIDVPLEEDLDKVRQRSGQESPLEALEIESQPEIPPEQRTRKYLRRASLRNAV
jgi:hypothetical protein